MSGNTEQPGTPGTPPAKPVKVVKPAAQAPATPVKKSAPAPAAQAPRVAKKAPAASSPVTKAAPAKKAAPAARSTTPATGAPAPKAPAAKAPAKAPAPKATETQRVPAAEVTAERASFGDKIKSGLAKAATFTTVADDADVARAEVPGTGLPGRSPRRARLRLSRVDPWSVAKVSFLLSVALGVVVFVAVLITWTVLGAAGVWDALNSVIASVASNSDGTSAFDVEDYVGTGRILGLTLVVSVVNVILLTAMATLAAYLYNMAAALLGGVELTLAEDNG